MSVTIKTVEMQYRGTDGQYHGINAVAEKRISDQIEAIDAALADKREEIEDVIDQIETEGNQAISDMQTAAAGIDEQAQTMMNLIAAAASAGTDPTLTTSGMAADAAATGTIVQVTTTEPTYTPGTVDKLWIYDAGGEEDQDSNEYEIPTYEEFSELESAMNFIKELSLSPGYVNATNGTIAIQSSHKEVYSQNIYGVGSVNAFLSFSSAHDMWFAIGEYKEDGTFIRRQAQMDNNSSSKSYSFTTDKECAYVIVSFRTFDAEYTLDITFSGRANIDETLTKRGSVAEAKTTGDKIQANVDKLTEINGAVSFDESTNIHYKKIDSYYIDNTGAASGASAMACTDYVDVGQYSELTYKQRKTMSSSATDGMAFYDSNKTYITGSYIGNLANQSEYGYADNTVSVPQNARYARFSMYKVDTYGTFSVSGKSKTTELNDTVVNLTKEVKGMLPLIGIANGWMQSNGNVQNLSSGANKITKYKITEGVESILLSGSTSISVATPAYCALWQVSNGSMMENGYIPVTTSPQSWDKYRVNIINGADEIWVITGFSVKVVGTIETRLEILEDSGESGTQWQGKKWFAYGTSLTTESFGHWVNTTASALGLIASNKGIAGGALVANRNIYNAIMDTTDGKNDADIITFEFGANDGASPLGTFDSVDDSTIFGAANKCIQALAETCPKAQIIIMPSLPSRYTAGHPEDELALNYQSSGGWTREEFNEGIRKLAQLNCVHLCPFGTEYAVPYYRSHLNNTYIADQIHPTALGGYNIAQEMIKYFKSIPNWFTAIPS